MSTSRADHQRAEVPDITLERFRLGELPPTDSARLETRLAADSTLRARLLRLERSDDELRRTYGSERLARDVRRRLSASGLRLPPRPWMTWLAAGAAVTLVLIVVQPGTRSTTSTASRPSPTVEEERAKGADTSLLVFRNSPSGAQLMDEHREAAAGDVVRVGYRVASPAFGVIVSIDGRGVVTTHLSDGGERAVPLEVGSTVLLNTAFELDDAPRVERFFLVTAAGPFDLAPVLHAVRQTAAAGTPEPIRLQLPPNFTSTMFSLYKDSRP